MGLTAGTRLGPYEIVAPLGAGGMGEVYTARDTRLDRVVAIKVLPSDLAADPDRQLRFEREARAVAALQHPNICTIHDVGASFLVMELLHGETLQQRIGRGALPAAELIEIGTALAGALDAAHAAGIVHRDIKPANIFLTSHGPKILDFGLAKAMGDASAAVTPTHSTRLAQGPLTAHGHTVGTFAYMSPEQLRGEEVDARSDLFSLGLVLYEMATGRPAFDGTTSAVISAAILHAAPRPPRQIRPELPARIEEIILKAIEKDRALRYQHASEMRADLQRAKRDSETTTAVEATARPAGATRRGLWLAGAAAAIVTAVLAGAYLWRDRAPRLTDKDTIVVADFANTTGDPVFDETLRQALSVELEQSPFLSIISDERIRRTLRLMSQAPNAPLTGDVARDLCVRTGSAAVVSGSIASLGNEYVLGVRAEHCATGDLLDQQQATAARKEDVLKTVSQLATKFRARVGESLSTVEEHSTPLEEATTPSLDALKALNAARAGADLRTSLSLLKRAIEIDPNFAVAHARLGLAYSNIGEWLLGEESTSKAYALRDRANDRERFYIATIYDRQVTGNLEREGETLRIWANTYPRDAIAVGLQGGFYAGGTGKYDLMITTGRASGALDPTISASRLNVVAGHLSLGRVKEAEAAFADFRQLFGDGRDSVVFAFLIAFMKNDTVAMDREASLARATPGAADWAAHLEALVRARGARLEAARQLSRHAIELTTAAGNGERAAVRETAAALSEALYGNSGAAVRQALHVLSTPQGRHVRFAAALALAIAGERSRAQAVADDLEQRFPEDTSVRFNYLPTLRALSALSANDASRAIELLQPATTYEFAQPGIAFYGSGGGFFGAMYPTYVRGQAYAALNKPAEAAAEFQKIVDHPGVVLADPMGALARLRLARALTQAGDTATAKAVYQDLLAIWKDADADLELPKQAKAELAALR